MKIAEEMIMADNDVKRIVILHSHNTFNNGSFMMLINFIHYLSASTHQKLEFVIDLQRDEDRKRLLSETTSINKITCFNFKITSPFKGNIFQKLRLLNEKLFSHPALFRKINASAIVILGGDDISEYYKGWQIVSDLYRIKMYSLNTQVFLVGQTIGPFYSWRKKIAGKWLRNTVLFFRDELSQNSSREYLSANKHFLSSDLAFLNLPVIAGNMLKQKHDLYKDSFIVIVPSGFSELYSSDVESYINGWIQIVRKVLNLDICKKYKIVLLPHVTAPEDDRIIIRRIFNDLSVDETKRVVAIDNELLPSQAREIIGDALFTVSGRMHPAISSFQKGKPAITLAYSIKYNGIIGKGLGRSDLIIKANDDRLWKSGEISEMVSEKITYLVNNYEKIKNEIPDAVEKNMELAKYQINELITLMEL